MMKFTPRKNQDKVLSSLLYDVIEGESRIGQIEVVLSLIDGYKQADVCWITPTSLAYNPTFKESAIEFAKQISKDYEPVYDNGIRYWVKQ